MSETVEEAQKRFEQERTKILSDLPDSVKNMFGQIGFAPLDDPDEIVPVLVVSPYSVPPKPVRDIYWHGMFSKSKRSKKLSELAYLVYHYGSDDLESCYSFIEQADFEPYEVGVQKGYDQIPKAIQDKIDNNVELTEEEVERVRGIREMQEDSLKAPLERRRGHIDFKERHEMLADTKDTKKKASSKSSSRSEKPGSAKKQKT